MNGTVISIPFRPDPEKTIATMHIDEEFREEFEDVFEKCIREACPKAAYSLQEAFVDGEETVIGTERFSSRIMHRNFTNANVRRAFVYAVTCGRELYDIAMETKDPLERWWVDSLSQRAMRAVDVEMTKVLKEKFRLGRISRMNPGSLKDFPISCQRALFRILKEEADEIGLTLTPTCLMLPYKSVSGVIYETETAFENCMLCPRENCPSRRAVYDKELARSFELNDRQASQI